MEFTDIHIHALYGVDDGPAAAEEMHRILRDAYADGTRTVCLTPHYHPGYFGSNQDPSAEAFRELQDAAAEAYPGLRLYLGNELRCSENCISWLEEGACRTLNGTGYVLVDFSEYEKAERIVSTLAQLLNAGYRPVLAHVERYRDLHGRHRQLSRLRADGVLLQMNTQSIFGGFGLRVRLEAQALLRKRMIDLVSSDAHNTAGRPPEMSGAYRYIARKCGEAYAQAVCRDNGAALLQNTFR